MEGGHRNLIYRDLVLQLNIEALQEKEMNLCNVSARFANALLLS